MTEGARIGRVLATVKPCEQYRFRVELPPELDRNVRADIRRRALQEANRVFLDCTRRYQSLAWEGAANLSFTDGRPSPSDSKSEFLHLLVCLKTIELCCFRFREGNAPEAPLDGVVLIETPLRHATRRNIERVCESLGLRVEVVESPSGEKLPRARIGGQYRSSRPAGTPFTLEPIKRIEDMRASLARKLSGVIWLRRCMNVTFRGSTLVLWPVAIASRMLFSLFYQAAAAGILKRLDGPRNVFVYFDLRLGRNRDVGAYLRWKYGAAFPATPPDETSYIPFTHIARACNGYSVPAMYWAFKALRRMKQQPLDGCVTVGYLIPPGVLWRLHSRRNIRRREIRQQLQQIIAETTDAISLLIFREFVTSLDDTNAFAMEIAAGYETFFGMLQPGVVVQADAVAKTARHFTACAKRRGGRVIYVADRICTDLRTSNQFIVDDGDNPHLPDRCIAFDQVTREEFTRQGLPADHVYLYHRNFDMERVPGQEISGRDRTQVVILLQAYEDNIGAMVRLGAEIAARFPAFEVIYQEHPNFPVCDRAKEKLLEESPGLRFLRPRESVDHHRTLAMITGYSTAAVPGILHGVPLIWLRRQIDNSIFCEGFLDRIGFAADKSDEVMVILKRLRDRDPAKLDACVAATAAAEAIFMPASANDRGFPEVLAEALDDSFAEIAEPASIQSSNAKIPRPLAALES